MNGMSNGLINNQLSQCESNEASPEELNNTIGAREFCELSLQDLENLYALGYAAWHEGDVDSATYYFAYLSQLNPDDYRFIFAFACALKKQGEYQHALNLFNHAMSMAASTDSSPLHIAICFQHLGEINKSREVLNTYIAHCFEKTNDESQCHSLRQQAETLLLSIND